MKAKRSAAKPALVLTATVALLTLFCVAPARGQTLPTLKKDVRVYVTVMDSNTVEDVFGRRIGHRFVAIQVTITNRSKDFQLLIHDVSLDLRPIYATLPEGVRKDRSGGDRFELSSLELSLLRGVAEKGQGQDRRNAVLRWFRGIGTVAAGLIGVAPFGPSYGDSVAVFNGPVISAYMDVFPDYTINQLNRLNDSAYRSNTLVPKQQAKVIVAFIPQRMFMDKKQRDLFRSDPVKLFDQLDFRKAVALVDGAFVTEVEDMPPVASAVEIEPAEAAKFQSAAPEVRGTIVGRLLSGSKISFVGPVPEGVTVEIEGEPAENRLDFVIKSPNPIPPGTPFTLQVSNEKGVQSVPYSVSYTPKLPTLTGVEPDPAEGEAGSEVTITLKGTNFIPNTGANTRATRVITERGSGLRVVSVDVTSDKTLDVTLSISGNAPRAASKLRVANVAGQSAGTATFTVKEPSGNN